MSLHTTFNLFVVAHVFVKAGTVRTEQVRVWHYVFPGAAAIIIIKVALCNVGPVITVSITLVLWMWTTIQ